MKTTLEIPDPIFRRAKAKAAEKKIPLRQLVTEALAEKLESPPRASASETIRLKLAGRLKHLHKETARVNALIEDEFERVDPDEPEE